MRDSDAGQPGTVTAQHQKVLLIRGFLSETPPPSNPFRINSILTTHPRNTSLLINT
jgi:hypothetical protein